MRRSAGALAAAGALLVSSGVHGQTAPATLVVHVSHLRSNAGQVGCMLFGAPKGFPTDPSAALQRRWCRIETSVSTCAFDPVASGTYAVACFHDENGNGKMDRGFLGIPVEGTVTSNHAKGFMGPPSFAAARFALSPPGTELALPMEY